MIISFPSYKYLFQINSHTINQPYLHTYISIILPLLDLLISTKKKKKKYIHTYKGKKKKFLTLILACDLLHFIYFFFFFHSLPLPFPSVILYLEDRGQCTRQKYTTSPAFPFVSECSEKRRITHGKVFWAIANTEYGCTIPSLSCLFSSKPHSIYTTIITTIFGTISSEYRS